MPLLRAALLMVLFSGCLSQAQAAGQHPHKEKSNVPQLEFVFEEFVTLAPSIHPGETPFGHSIKADYMIQTDDGAIINVLNQRTDCAFPGASTQLYTSPTFEAPLGPYAWLNGGVFVGTVEGTKIDGKPAVHIRFFAVR